MWLLWNYISTGSSELSPCWFNFKASGRKIADCLFFLHLLFFDNTTHFEAIVSLWAATTRKRRPRPTNHMHLHSWQKFYTTAGCVGRDKFLVCLPHTPFEALYPKISGIIGNWCAVNSLASNSCQSHAIQISVRQNRPFSGDFSPEIMFFFGQTANFCLQHVIHVMKAMPLRTNLR